MVVTAGVGWQAATRLGEGGSGGRMPPSRK